MLASHRSSMTRLARRAAATAALASILTPALTGLAIAQAKWVMATEYPASNISGVGLTTFARSVAARTDGAVMVALALDNALKISSGEMVRAAQDGRIAGGDAFAGPLEATDPVFGLASLPFVVQSVEAAKAINARARPLYEAALTARGLKLLYMTIWPSTGLWSAQALVEAADLRAMSVRSYDYNSAEVLRAAGAKAEYLPFNEAISKLKARELNAILTSGDGGAGRKLWDELRHFTAINYAITDLARLRAERCLRGPSQAAAGRGAGGGGRDRGEPVRAARRPCCRELCENARERRGDRGTRACPGAGGSEAERRRSDRGVEAEGACCSGDDRGGGDARVIRRRRSAL